MTQPLWPLLVYGLSVVGLVLIMLGLSYLLGQRHRERATNEPYEGGIASYGSARVRYTAQFYVVGLLFLVFDLEAAFLYAWAIALRPAGWSGYWGALVFIGILSAVLVYEWRMGALDYRRKTPARTPEGPTAGISLEKETR